VFPLVFVRGLFLILSLSQRTPLTTSPILSERRAQIVAFANCRRSALQSPFDALQTFHLSYRRPDMAWANGMTLAATVFANQRAARASRTRTRKSAAFAAFRTSVSANFGNFRAVGR